MTHDFTKPGFYLMRNGEQAEIIAHRQMLIGVACGNATAWSANGYCISLSKDYDLIEPWAEPVTIPDGFINIYRNGWGTVFDKAIKPEPGGYPPSFVSVRRIRWDGEKIIDVTEPA